MDRSLLGSGYSGSPNSLRVNVSAAGGMQRDQSTSFRIAVTSEFSAPEKNMSARNVSPDFDDGPQIIV